MLRLALYLLAAAVALPYSAVEAWPLSEQGWCA